MFFQLSLYIYPIGVSVILFIFYLYIFFVDLENDSGYFGSFYLSFFVEFSFTNFLLKLFFFDSILQY
jgi:hypothetical protein